MKNTLMLQNINHVVTVVKDLTRSLKFYRDFLGIPQIQSQVDDLKIVWLQLPSGIMLHLIENPLAPAFPKNIHHAFEMTDLDLAIRLLENHGITIERSGTRNDGQRFIFFRDPDDNLVEICTESGF